MIAERAATEVSDGNAEIWRRLYAAGGNDLLYPNDVFVRYCYRFLDKSEDRRILDYGFGTGANLIHLANLGYDLSGVEISESAIAKARSRSEERGLKTDLHLIQPGMALPFEDGVFDSVIAWQVLCYNDWDTLRAAVRELERVLKPGGKVLCATTAPGDISQTMATHLGDGIYRSNVPGQEGCTIVIPEEAQLSRFFPGRTLDVGDFGYRIGATVAHHWLISYRKV